MSDFTNLHQAKSDPVSFNSAPFVRYVWVCETTQNLGTHSSHIPNIYQQQAQTTYPFNMLHNSQVLTPQQNFNQRPQLLHESFQTQNAFWAPGNAVFQPAPSLASPVSVTGYIVANPQLLQNGAGNQTDEHITNTVGITNQMISAAQVPSQPVSLDLVNAGFQPEQIWLQQQHGKLLHNNHQQDHQLLQNNLQQHDRGQLLLNNHQQDHQLLQNNHQQDHQLLHNNHQQDHQLLHNNHQQDHQLLQNNLQQHDHYEQQEQTGAHIEHSSQTSLNENLSHHATLQGSTQKAKVNDDDGYLTENISDRIPQSVKTAQLLEASAGTHLRGSFDLRPSALPISFPTTLNPSLQIKNPSRLKEPVAIQKSESYEVISRSNYTMNETKIKDQDDVNESEILKNSQNVLVKSHLYKQTRNKDDCIRCHTKVYPMERTGPIKDAVYHKRCFTCVSCGTTLNLKNFHHNPNDADDPSVFCMSHKPKGRLHSCDANAVFIKTALTTPKLDKVNEQIRTDRHPSEVLARSGHMLSTTSGLSPAQECFYYGMEDTENVASDTSQKSYPEEDSRKEHLVYVGDQHEQPQHQLVNEQCEQQQEQDSQHADRKETSQYQLQELQEQKNTQLQQGILENDRKLDEDVANMTISRIDRISTTGTDNQADEVFLSNDQNNIPTTENDDKDKQFSVSSLEFSQLSSARRQEINSGNEFERNFTTHFKLDNHESLQQQIQNLGNTDEEQKLITRERPSSQSSISTSRSISPMQVHTSFSFSENEEGHRSSFSSDLSSRDRSSFSSDLSSPGSNSPGNNLNNDQRTGLKAPAKQFSGDQLTRLAHGMRADRPSTHQYYHDMDTQKQAGPSTRMAETNMSNNKLDIPRSSSDLDRYLPHNERMRLDRPSQYSREVK